MLTVAILSFSREDTFDDEHRTISARQTAGHLTRIFISTKRNRVDVVADSVRGGGASFVFPGWPVSGRQGKYSEFRRSWRSQGKVGGGFEKKKIEKSGNF